MLSFAKLHPKKDNFVRRMSLAILQDLNLRTKIFGFLQTQTAEKGYDWWLAKKVGQKAELIEVWCLSLNNGYGRTQFMIDET